MFKLRSSRRNFIVGYHLLGSGVVVHPVSIEFSVYSFVEVFSNFRRNLCKLLFWKESQKVPSFVKGIENGSLLILTLFNELFFKSVMEL